VTATDEEILAHARVHARQVAGELAVDLSALEWATSARARRRAGACRWDQTRGVAIIVLSRQAYAAYDRERFEEVVRHELIHAWEFQHFGESDHGPRFLEKAAELSVPRHCDSFVEPRYRLHCVACAWTATRHCASQPIKTPGRYRCGVCGEDYTVEHVDSGRTWASAKEYKNTKATLGERW